MNNKEKGTAAIPPGVRVQIQAPKRTQKKSIFQHFPFLLGESTFNMILQALGICVLFFLVKSTHTSYRAWLALGPGGVPYNLLGWAIQSIFSVTISIPTISLADPAVFVDLSRDNEYAGHAVSPRTPFVEGPLPLRAGPTPLVPGTVAPQRQITQKTADETRLAGMHRYLQQLTEANKHLGLVMQPARLEGGLSQAVYLPASAAGPTSSTKQEKHGTSETPRFLAKVRGEICHVHGDGSSHVTLSFADAAEAVTKGWAQRHKLSGVSWGVIPPTYLFVYAPRNDEDLVVWKALMRAGVSFVCGQKVQEPDEKSQ